jgi:hypothetical protein
MTVSFLRSYEHTSAYSNVSLNSNVAFLSNANGVTFGAAGNVITASVAAGPSAGIGGLAVNAATTYTSGTVVFSNANGVTFGTNGQTVTASVVGGGGVIATAVYEVASAGSTGTVTRYAPEDHRHAGVAAMGVSNTGNTAGNTASRQGTWVIAGTNGVTVSASSGAAGVHTVWLSANSGNTTTGLLSAINVSGGATSNNLSAITFANGSGVTFGLTGSVMTASVATIPLIATSVNPVASAASTGTAVRYAPEDHRHAGVGVLAAGSNTGNTAGNTATQVGSWVIAGTNGVTVSGSTGGAGVHTVWLSAGGGGGLGGIAVNAAGTITAGTVVFSNSNNVTFGLNGSTITASITAAGGAGATMAMYQNLGPLNTISGALGTFVFTGSHRSILVSPLHPQDGAFPADISVSTLWLNGSMSGSTATMSVAYGSTIRIGIYTRNVGSLSLENSASFVFSRGANATNNSTDMAGPRFIPFVSSAWSAAPVFRAGSQYWIATHWSSSGALNQSGNILGAGMGSTLQRQGTIGQSTATATSMGWGLPFYGVYTATTAAFPASIGNAQLIKISASAGFVPHVVMVAHTALTNF